MSIGTTIKELRNKEGMTQKELADELHVTYQAVSRWENDDAEPSFDTVKEICRILHCTSDELFGIENKEEKEVVELEKVEATAKQVLCICENCNAPIYEQKDIHRVSILVSPAGRGHSAVYKDKVLCNKCYEADLAEKKAKAEAERQAKLKAVKTRRIHSFVWPSLIATIGIIISIVLFTQGEVLSGGVGIAISILSYAFLADLILNNTFVTDMWLEVASWGFVSMPGVIFSLSFDGIVFLIAAKIFLFIVSMILAIGGVVLATILGLVIGIFVYPFALVRNFKGIVD